VSSDAPPGIVLLVRRPQYVRAALQTVRDLEASEPLSTVPVEVVVCGKAVRALRTDEPLAARLAEQVPDRVQVLACGMSIENLGMNDDALSPVVDVVPDGLAHALKRKAAGYLSVDL
jgi:intracellular sulfur oxidation DsrE/DsrF family protein